MRRSAPAPGNPRSRMARSCVHRTYATKGTVGFVGERGKSVGERDDDLRAGAPRGLALPRLGDRRERERLTRDRDAPGGRVLAELAVALGEHLARQREEGVPEDVHHPAAHPTRLEI